VAAPTIFRASDASAPTLNGNAGSLVAVLDGCLVNGYGSQTALGWAKPFTATNKAVYRAPAGVRHYLDVDDSAPDATALGRNARVRGYEVASAVGTGTGPFPTTAQAATAVVVKSSTADAVARPWLLVGDDRTFYFFTSALLTLPMVPSTHTWPGHWGFGEILSALTGDVYRSFCAWYSPTSTATTDVAPNWGNSIQTTIAGSGYNAAMPRSYTGAGGSMWANALGSGIASASLAYPNAPDGGLYMNGILVGERGTGTTVSAPTALRGRFRGVFQPVPANTGISDGDTFSGTGDFAGRTFMLLRSASSFLVAVETTAWAASS
jgi:hypothetical protein